MTPGPASNPIATTLLRAVGLHRAGQLDEALALYSAVLTQEPRQLDALHLSGVIAHQRGAPTEALTWFDRALRVNDAIAEIHANRAAALRELHRGGDALTSLEHALALAPATAATLNNLAAVLLDLGRAQDALAATERSLILDATQPVALYNQTSALHALGRNREALAACERALLVLPKHTELLNRHGNLLRTFGLARRALDSYERALRTKPDHAGILVNRAHALADLGLHERSAESYRQAHAIAPDMPLLPGQWLHARLRICDWRDVDAAFARIAEGIDAGLAVCEPFLALLAPLTAAQQRHCAEIHVQRNWRALPSLRPPAATQAPRRLRLGYFSADFREHPTAQLLAGLIEQHDCNRFETFAFAFGPPDSGPMRARLRAAFDHFIEVADDSDGQVVQRARDCGIDIAIDLGGHTHGSRCGVFARRAAPLQVGWLGFPGTSGAPFIDHLLADATVLPPGHEAECTESIVRLPHCYQANDARRRIAEASPTREELGLPADGFVWCCFNNLAKITPAVFSIWMKLLTSLPGSVLWLMQGESAATRNLLREAASRDVDPQRLVFARRKPLPEHLARHRHADLFVDTWPYNAHTTASDALWAGLPVLTRRGETFAGRVAASLLRTVGLPELVTNDDASYLRVALELANDSGRLDALRQRLVAQRAHTPLFDTRGSTRDIEHAFEAMWQRMHERNGARRVAR